MSNSAVPFPSKVQIFWLAIRPKTLPASLSPVLLGTASVPFEQLNWLLVICAFGCAVFLQITVNLANDFFDAKNGVDSDQRLGPVRVTQSQLASPMQMACGIVLFVLLSILCGLVLIVYSDWLMLGVGVLCVLAALGYSGGPYPIASHGLGEIAVLIFFGWVAVMGSFYIQTQSLNGQLFTLATALGLVLAAVMLVNNIRDIPTDRSAGKTTLAVRLGNKNSKVVFTGLFVVAAVLHCLAFTAFTNDYPIILTTVPIVLCFPFAHKICSKMWISEGAALNPLLASTAQLSMLYSVSTSLLLLIY
ncbi:1,4-dihydroxy-2-naphthoate polyprenyltransferase [Teredinibacter haidensis]|uniref:1,4-dihydroxy-2-naphthoate polyprenyltransferase n=1 Tax=Teredinibacter haidensis TaxID=2731755 RepID=UPI000948B60B|nr:1,4-dihydroxy-2-naphthoate polyprenyltransferase [Teredinibacter haidensis]